MNKLYICVVNDLKQKLFIMKLSLFLSEERAKTLQEELDATITIGPVDEDGCVKTIIEFEDYHSPDAVALFMYHAGIKYGFKKQKQLYKDYFPSEFKTF